MPTGGLFTLVDHEREEAAAAAAAPTAQNTGADSIRRDGA